MGFSLPKDIENNLKRKYPDVDVRSFINSLFQEIFDKVFKDGSCPITGLGKFLAFVTYSSRIGSEVVRFKFRPSQKLVKMVRDDQYLIEKLPVRAKVPFTEQHEEKCKDKRIIKLKNDEAIVEVAKLEREKTIENLAYNKVLDILEKEDII